MPCQLVAIAGISGSTAYAQFWDTCTQTALSTASPVRFNNTDSTNYGGIGMTGSTGTACLGSAAPFSSPGNSLLGFTTPGIYTVDFSARVTRMANGLQTADVWLRRGNATSLTDVSNSNAQFSYTGNGAKAVANVKWNVPVTCTGGTCDSYQINWLAPLDTQGSTSTASMQLAPTTGRSGPSAILAVTLVGPLPTSALKMPTRRLLSARPNIDVAKPEVRWMDMSEYMAKAATLTQRDATA
jgi:hypothetical protein